MNGRAPSGEGAKRRRLQGLSLRLCTALKHGLDVNTKLQKTRPNEQKGETTRKAAKRENNEDDDESTAKNSLYDSDKRRHSIYTTLARLYSRPLPLIAPSSRSNPAPSTLSSAFLATSLSSTAVTNAA